MGVRASFLLFEYLSKTTLILSVLIALSFNAFASSASSSAAVKLDVPQVISIDSPGDPAKGVSAQVMNTVWTITSNNAFDISFTGDSKSDTGVTQNYPKFVKADINAAGSSHTDRYDNLDTVFGLVVSDLDTTETGVTVWEGGGTPDGTPQELVLALQATGSPDKIFGTLMPDDDDSQAVVTLHSKGTSSTHDQSGDYIAIVTIVATGDEIIVP